MNKYFKSVVTSAAIAVTFASIAVGTTFALFTSKAETSIDVKSGKIALKADVKIDNAWELRNVPMTKNSDYNYTSSIGASISKDEYNVIHLDKLAPGDGAEFSFDLDNSGTNINTKQRLFVSLQGELSGALEVEAKLGDVRQFAFKGEGTSYTTWEDVNAFVNPNAYTVTINFPDGDNGEILFGNDNNDNQYQDKEAVLLLGYEAIQGNAYVDDTLEAINTRLGTSRYVEGANDTMYDALRDLDSTQVAAIKERGYVYSVESDKFYSFNETPADAYRYFKIYDSMPTTQNYSIYATGEGWTDIDNLTVGLDVGDVTTISNITYDRSEADDAHSVVIRTNSASTNLTINAANDTVTHYGEVGSLNIIAVANQSYHEYGKVAFTEILSGRIVLENDSEIKHIHVNANENADGFEEVIIADKGAAYLPEAITRDQVDVTEAKPVVTIESGSTSETVYVYPYTDSESTKTGTTEQTATQNTAIATDLGKLVLDNGKDAGEKAMSINVKEEVMTDVVNEAKAPEIAKDYQEDENAYIYNLTTGASYDNLYTAIDEAQADIKTSLILLKDISTTGNKNYTIAANKNIVLDLNGKVLSTYAPDEEKSYTIVNYGTLTIKDNSDVNKDGSGTGKIVSTVNKADMADVPGYASNTITNSGKLTVESGLIENKGAGYACFAIDNQTNGTLYNPELVINGGKMLQESEHHYAVRMFCNSKTNLNKVTVNGGVIEGGYAFWMQLPNNNANKAELVVNGGKFIAYDGAALYFGGSGSTADGRQFNNISVTFNGGTLNKVMMSGVSTAERAPSTFDINGGYISELALGTNLNPIIKGGTFNSKVISTWGYVYIVDDEVYEETSSGDKGDKYESPWDLKSYWEANGYSFTYDSNYGDYVVSIEKSVSDVIGSYIDVDYRLINNNNGTSSVVHK